MELGKLIGKGMTAEVYGLNENQIIKLFKKEINDQQIMKEFTIAKTINKLGIPAPIVFETTTLNERKGIIFERINGMSLLSMMEKKPKRIRQFGKQMARVHYQIHQNSSSDLINQIDLFPGKIEATKSYINNQYKEILEYFQSLPQDNQVCHGDFHPDNIMNHVDRQVVLDWTNVYSGNPLSDVARTILLIRTPYVPDGLGKMQQYFLKFLKWVLSNSYIKEYKRLSNVKYEDIHAWFLPNAAIRLLEEIPGEKSWLLIMINRLLKNNKKNSLS